MDKVNDLPINVFDAAVILVLLISAFLAYARGFVHEVLSIGGWIGAIFATFYGFPYLKPYAREFIAIELAADLTAGLIVFIASLVVLSYLSRSISKKVQSSALNALDRALGFLFGLARGAIVVCIAYLGLGLILPENEQPSIVAQAKTMELIKPGAELIAELLPANASSDAISDAASKAGQKTKELFGAKDVVNDLIAPKPKSEEQTETGAYGRKERQDMERLIDSNQTTN